MRWGHLVPECSGQSHPTTCDPGPYGTRRNPEHFGNLGVIEVTDVSQHDSGAIFGRQREKGGIERQAIGDTRGRIGEQWRAVVGIGKTGDWSPSSAAHLVEAGICRDPIHPGRELRPTVETGESSQHGDEGFLRGVRGVGVIARHSPAQHPDARLLSTQQLVERVTIAGLSRRNE